MTQSSGSWRYWPALLAATTLASTLTGCGGGKNSIKDSKEQAEVTTAQVREIAKEAYIYGYPMVDNYRIQYAYFQDKQSSQYVSPWNTLHSDARVYTPADTAVQTPNSDTPYSTLGADLRAEPLVLTVPEIESNRYYSIQFVDAYTYNVGYVGSRTTGNKAGKFLLDEQSSKLLDNVGLVNGAVFSDLNGDGKPRDREQAVRLYREALGRGGLNDRNRETAERALASAR